MNLTTAVWMLVFVNTMIEATFALGVARRAGPAWQWPPVWLWIVVGWLMGWSLFQAAISWLWLTGQVGFLPTTDGSSPWKYLGPLTTYTFFHSLVLLYWVSGRTTRVETPSPREEEIEARAVRKDERGIEADAREQRVEDRQVAADNRAIAADDRAKEEHDAIMSPSPDDPLYTATKPKD